MNEVLVQEMKDELRAMCSLGVDEISVEDARAAVWFFDGDGYRPGSFTLGLVTAISLADMPNRFRLALGFPGLVAAVVLAKDMTYGMTWLRERAGASR